MLTEAQTFAIQRSQYARALRAWADVQVQPEARRSLLRLASEQDRAVDVLLNLPAQRRKEDTLH